MKDKIHFACLRGMSHLLPFSMGLLLGTWIFSQNAAPGGEAAESPTPVELYAHLSKTNYPESTNIVLLVTLTNHTAQHYVYVTTGYDLASEFSYKLLGENQNEIPLTRWGTSLLREQRPISVMHMVVPAFQAQTTSVVLDQIFELRSPQRYELVVSKALPIAHGTNVYKTIRSNPVHFTVGRN